jgi:hypothetical protein
MLRRLLNIASIICLVLCVALMGMWVRSYHFVDEMQSCFTFGDGLVIRSVQGRMGFTGYDAGETIIHSSWSLHSNHYDEPNTKLSPSLKTQIDSHLGFALLPIVVNPSGKGYTVAVPFWFLVLIAGSLAMAFRLRWPLRFNVRSLFIATTVLAMALGMIAWLDRAWIGK